MFIDFICGKCARKEGVPLEERKEMAKSLDEGENVCSCGRIIVVKNGRVSVISNKTMKSVLE